MKHSIIKEITLCFTRCYSNFGKLKILFFLSLFLTSNIQTLNLFETYLFANITNSLYEKNSNEFLKLVFIAALFGTATIVLNIIVYNVDIHIKLNLSLKFKTKAMEVLFSRDEDIAHYSVGEIESIMQEDSDAIVTYVYQVSSYIFNVIVVLYLSIVLYKISSRWAVLFGIVQISVGIIQKKGAAVTKNKAKECLSYENEYYKYLNEELNEIHAIRFENLRRDIIEFNKKHLNQIRQKRKKQADYSIKLLTVSKILMYSGKIILFLGMGREVLLNNVKMTDFIIFYSYITMFSGNFMPLVQMVTVLQPMLVHVKRILSVYDIESKYTECKEKNSEKSRGTILRLGRIQFCDVRKNFGERLLFENVSIVLEPEKSYAIIGLNGTGKTTFAKILFGEEKISNGKILVDGKSIDNYKKRYGLDICYFSSKPFVLSGLTIKEEILGGIQNKEMSRKKIKKICQDFHILKDIESMQFGFDSIVGQDVILSSGQMKKIQLIRASLNASQMVILDEPFANLDEQFKKSFDNIFRKYFSTKRIVVIEHSKENVPYIENVLQIFDEKIHILQNK